MPGFHLTGLGRGFIPITVLVISIAVGLMVVGQGHARADTGEEYDFKFGETVMASFPRESFLRPNETEVVHFYVTNKGSLNDSYNISLVSTNTHWFLALDLIAIGDVSPNATIRFNLTVAPPDDAEPGNYTEVNISVMSLGSNLTRSHVLDFWYIKLRDVDMEYVGKQQANLSTELEGRWAVEVRNAGDYHAEYRLRAGVFRGEVELTHGFLLHMSSEVVALAPGEVITVIAVLGIDDTQAFAIRETYHLNLWAIDTDEAEVWDYVRIGWQVPLVYSSTVEPARVNLTIPPGCTREVRINITQWTTDHMGYPWVISVETQRPSWPLGVSQQALFIIGSSTQYTDLVIGVPGDAMPGENVTHQVLCANHRRPSSNRLVTIHVEMKEYPQLLVMASRSRVWTLPPSTIDLNIIIENPGNVPQPLEFNMSLARITGGHVVVDSMKSNMTIDPFDGTVYTYNLKVTRATRAGTYLFALECVDVGGMLHVATVTIYVKEVLALEVDVVPSGKLVFDPNQPAPEVRLMVRNTGNVDVPMEPRLYKGVGAYHANIGTSGFPEGPLDLGAQENVTLSAVLSVDLEGPYSKSGEFYVDLGEEVPHNWRFHRFEFAVRCSDLMFGEVTHPRVVADGQRVTVTAIVVNGGDAPCPWTYVGVFGPQGLQKDATAIVPSLEPGERVFVDITFTASAEREKYQLMVDPNDDIVELGQGPNVHELTLSFRDNQGISYPCWVVVFVCGVTLLIAFSAIRSRRRSSLSGWD